jgi:hypothetical protein
MRLFVWQNMIYVAMLSCQAALTLDAATKKNPSEKQKVENVELLQPPSFGGQSVEVAVALYVTDFVAIDETKETFEVSGYLTAKWKDPRLALPTGATDQKKRGYRLGEIWAPSIESANTISHKAMQYWLTSDKDGVVTYVERFDSIVSNNFDFRRFPFDTQLLRLEFHTFFTSDEDVRFAPQPLPSTGISRDRDTELSGWSSGEVKYTVDRVRGGLNLPSTNEAVFQIAMKRRSGFYIWKILVPLIMLALIPSVVFWIDVEMFDWLLKIPMTMMLSMVAFEFTIARDLPRIGYVSFLDAVFLASFTLCFLCIFEILGVFLLQMHGKRGLAVKLQTMGRWAYPLTYLIVIALLAVGFLA